MTQSCCSPEAWPEISIEVSSWARQAEEAAISAAIATGCLELLHVDIGPTEGLGYPARYQTYGENTQAKPSVFVFCTSLLASLISTF